jgi:aquaporin Z
MPAVRSHWPEYACEAALLGTFMFVACALAVVLEHPAGALHHALPDTLTRRAAFGAAMGLTAVALVHSRWGKRSGAHLNPAVTLSFAWLRRIRPEDAAAYAAAQLAGASIGVAAAWAVFGARLAHPSIHFVVTRPGDAGVLVAFAAEVAMSFVLMATVLLVSGSRRSELTGACAGALVFLYITFEAPLSGMSMNPARSFGSALVAACSARQRSCAGASPAARSCATRATCAASSAARARRIPPRRWARRRFQPCRDDARRSAAQL